MKPCNGIMSSVALASVNLSTSAKDGLSNSAETIASSVAPPAIELDELTVAELQSGMSSGKYSAHSLAKKYLGKDKYPFAQPGEVRVMYEIEPRAANAMG